MLRPGGCLLIVVPDEDLYEQSRWPSQFNGDHKWSLTIHKRLNWSPVSINLADLVVSLPAHQVVWLRPPGIWDRTCSPAARHIEVLLRKQDEKNMSILIDTAQVFETGVVSTDPLRIYTGVGPDRRHRDSCGNGAAATKIVSR